MRWPVQASDLLSVVICAAKYSYEEKSHIPFWLFAQIAEFLMFHARATSSPQHFVIERSAMNVQL